MRPPGSPQDLERRRLRIGRLLHALGWSPQKPQRRAVERDEDEIRRWVKEEWPREKITPHG